MYLDGYFYNLRTPYINTDISPKKYFRLFDKTVKSHGFLAKGLKKEGKISAIKFLELSSKETT